MYQYLKRPKVSIICIPAYENPEGITRLLDSILTQLFTDYEIIITDDSKTDRVEAAVRAAEDGFVAYGFSGIDTGSRIRYYRNKERKGAVANWNEAVSRAQGEYVKIMHHDDWFTDERCLALFVEMLDQHPEADMAFSGSYQVEPGMSAEELAEVRKGRRFGLFVKPRTESEKRHAVKSKFARGIAEKDEALLREDFRNLYLGNTIGAPSAVIVRKSALDKWGITYDTNLTWLVDEEYYLQILQNNPHYAFTVKPLISIGLSYSQLKGIHIRLPQIRPPEGGCLFCAFSFGCPCEKSHAGKGSLRDPGHYSCNVQRKRPEDAEGIAGETPCNTRLPDRQGAGETGKKIRKSGQCSVLHRTPSGDRSCYYRQERPLESVYRKTVPADLYPFPVPYAVCEMEPEGTGCHFRGARSGGDCLQSQRT